MPDSVATVTADTGPGIAVTAKVIHGVKSFLVDTIRQVMVYHTSNSDPTSAQIEFDLDGVTTFTATISAGVWTITVS